MSTTYRDATIDDVAALEEIFRLSFCHTFGHLYPSADLAAFLAGADVAAWREELADPAMRVRLASIDGSAVGFARIGPGSMPKQHPAGSIELRQLYLLPGYQGRGIGSALLDWAIAEARGGGATWLYLSVYIDNPGARRLYRGAGFVEEGPYHFMVGSHADEDIVMRLAL